MSDDVKDGMVFEAVRGPRRGERFTVGQSPEYAVPFVKRWLSIGTVRRVELRIHDGSTIETDAAGRVVAWRSRPLTDGATLTAHGGPTFHTGSKGEP